MWWDFSDGIIANFLFILTVKQFRKSVNLIFDKVMAYENIVPNFLGHTVGCVGQILYSLMYVACRSSYHSDEFRFRAEIEWELN